jgi:two-component system chemotaxis sensor kinase CheA
VVPLTSVEQSLRLDAVEVFTIQDRGQTCLLRGRPLPLFHLADLFGLRRANGGASLATALPTPPIIMVLHDGARRCGLVVDALLGQQQVVIKSLGDGVPRVGGLSGAAILGDGNVSLILDVPGLIDLATQSATTQSAAMQSNTPQSSPTSRRRQEGNQT